MIGLADCNNFFVSCERSVDPSLEGRAVVVMSNNDGCIVARSNEAKALGIRMGQPAFEIRDLISSGQVIALSGQHLLYRDISLKIHDIFRKFVPHAIDYSIDESFLDMKGIPDNMLPAIGNEICRTCWNDMRIPVTIGFAQTKTLAKIITEYCKK
ncbi:MAG: SOS mutagenesis and repair protein UmuC, partial [Muribaculaceae bacterium]|nr:SOS mutagenesis and repair protein UmuC [Muribaculaceae bacterium]